VSEVNPCCSSLSGLSFVKVHGAGHMVPRDQPAAALAMLQMFLNGTMH